MLTRRTPVWLLAFGASLLSACGGGAEPSAEETSNELAQSMAADASVLTADLLTLADSAVTTTQTLAASTATADGRMQPMALVSGQAQAQATSSASLACPGGGSATLGLSGPNAAALVNGQLDAGEVYTVAYNQCRGAGQALALNGGVTLTVDSASGGQLGITVSAAVLQATLPRGSAMLDGTWRQTLAETVDGADVTTRQSQFSANSLQLRTGYGTRSSRFTLSNVNLAHSSQWIGGVQQASQYSGTHQLEAVLPAVSFSTTVSTQGQVSYDGNGLPVAGSWRMVRTRGSVACTVANGTVTLTLDENGDGIAERSWTLSREALGNAAG